MFFQKNVKTTNSSQNQQKVLSMLTGYALLRDARHNKGTAFTPNERKALKLDGLLPPETLTQDEQVKKCFTALDNCHTDLERYVYMQGLANRNRTLFFRVLRDRLVELLPIVYTPTVGKAVSENVMGIFESNRQSYVEFALDSFSLVPRVWTHSLRAIRPLFIYRTSQRRSSSSFE
jgi:hypothetical protein